MGTKLFNSVITLLKTDEIYLYTKELRASAGKLENELFGFGFFLKGFEVCANVNWIWIMYIIYTSIPQE